MSALKSYLSIKKWNARICFYKNLNVQHFSKFLIADNLLDENTTKINKCNHPIRFYSSEKCGQTTNTESSENINTSKKSQEISSVDSQLNYCRKKETTSIAVVGGGCTTLCTFILLKQNPALKEIRLIDTDMTMRLSLCDVKQIDTATKIRFYDKKSLLDGLRDVDVVVLMDETNTTVGNKGPFFQFDISSNFVKHIVECMASACPNALIVVFTQPVTAVVPLISEIYKKYNIYNPSKIIGSAALDSMKINAVTANFLDLNPSCIDVPITGGVDSLTFVPLLSKTTPFDHLTVEDQYALIQNLKLTTNNLFENEAEGPTLSAGLAATKFISTLICGLQNHNSICIANAFVRSNIYPSCQYMTSKVQFGRHGVQKIFGLPKISPNEVCSIERSVPIINRIVDSAKHFVRTGNIK